MVEEKDLTIMKYIRTYETEEKFLTDKDSTSRGFRLKPTLYKYSEAGDHVHLELDDPRKHGDSTWIHLEFTKATEFSFKISNVTGDDSNTLNYTIDWGDGTVETNTATRGDDGLYTFTHSYAIDTYNMELYGTDRSYMFVGSRKYKPYFSTPTAVKRVVVGDGVEIGISAFSYCNSLTSINLPSTLTSIGYYTFAYCSSLSSITISEGVTSIGGTAFNGCSKLTSINLPSTLTSIGYGAFWNCSSLSSITIPEGVTSINTSAFDGCTSLSSITIPEGVTSIGDYTFNGCTSLSSINIPKGVTSIGMHAFDGCTSLTSISSLNTTAPTLDSYNVFYNLPTDGTLHIKPGATGYDAWLSKLPSGWTIVEDL